MDSDTWLQYLQIFHGDSISLSVFSRLLKEYRSLSQLLKRSEAELSAVGLNASQIASLQKSVPTAKLQQQIDVDLEWSSRPGNTIVCYESEAYPGLLREIDSAPPLLYITGLPATLSATNFAIVGSRKASAYGRRNAYWMAQELTAAGLQICSGLAAGVDSYAHKGALDSNSTTLAVMGCGIDKIYPATNKELAKRISDSGALISEFPLGTPPFAYNFPRRNRLISGMSLGTLVVEANARSGSLITARFAIEQNREVFAFPGPITSQQSRGCHRLIKQGAKLVEEPSDILEELGLGEEITRTGSTTIEAEGTTEQTGDASNHKLLTAIDYQGCLFQTLLEDSELDIQALNLQLIGMEMAGLIRLEGGRYYRVS